MTQYSLDILGILFQHDRNPTDLSGLSKLEIFHSQLILILVRYAQLHILIFCIFRTSVMFQQ